MQTYGNLLKAIDFTTTKVTIKGTDYDVGYLVVLEVLTSDVLVIGEIEKVVVRKSNILFIVSVHDAARQEFQFFKTSPRQKLAVVKQVSLADYRPLMKRGHGTSFPFVLHHHLPTPL